MARGGWLTNHYKKNIYDGKIAPLASFLCNCKVYGSQFLLGFCGGKPTDFLPTLTSSLFFSTMLLFVGTAVVLSLFQDFKLIQT